jgi:hypothetical protein
MSNVPHCDTCEKTPTQAEREHELWIRVGSRVGDLREACSGACAVALVLEEVQLVDEMLGAEAEADAEPEDGCSYDGPMEATRIVEPLVLQGIPESLQPHLAQVLDRTGLAPGGILFVTEELQFDTTTTVTVEDESVLDPPVGVGTVPTKPHVRRGTRPGWFGWGGRRRG